MIYIQNIYENEYLKWYTVRKVDKDYTRELYFKDIEFPIIIGDIHRTEKIIVLTLTLLVMKTRETIELICQKLFDLLLIVEEGKIHYVLIKDFNAFSIDHALCCRRKFFSGLQVKSAEI